MASELQSTIERVLVKTKVLVEKYREQESLRKDAEQEIEKLQGKIAEMTKELETLRQENEYLRVVRSISSSEEGLEQSKAIIDQLVRDVDKCISQLR